MALTKRTIEGMTYRGHNGQRQVAWDDELPGFGVRVYPTGKKALVLSYRVAWRKRLMTLGSYGQYTVDQARKHLVDIDNGIDPLQARQKDTQGETIKMLCTAYKERHTKPHKWTWSDDQRRIEAATLLQALAQASVIQAGELAARIEALEEKLRRIQ
jgi:hypothetical protein